MNRQEAFIVVVLFLVLMGWMWNQNRLSRERLERERRDPAVSSPAPEQPSDPLPADLPTPDIRSVEPAIDPVLPDAADTMPSDEPENRITNRIDAIEMVFSSKGGVLLSVTLLDPRYRRNLPEDSGPTAFIFNDAPALLLEGLPGIDRETDFSLFPLADGTGVRMLGEGANGLQVERFFRMSPDYRLSVTDRFSMLGEEPVAVSTNRIMLGAMGRGISKSDTLGVDTLPVLERRSKVRHWENRDLPSLFKASGGGCARRPMVTDETPLRARGEDPRPQRWAAIKNRFFVQLIRSETPNIGVDVYARRDPHKAELAIERVHAGLRFPAMVLQPGETLERHYEAYIGPKRLNLLRRMGHGEDGVMQFGFFGWMCRLLLPTLNGLYRLIPNYGIAIILLTVLVRILFWPVTHRSTEAMKKMQAIQPQVKALQQKFKDNPQQLQQETWKLYRENKVNPMASCLPMLVQIPVFIALFTVLRSAVELRFASFLWIRDLSEPEGLFADVLPLPLNILPLLMAVTMAWQQHLTPSTGDPQQKKMMMFMPVMMLFFFYTMPSALVLYWTTSQIMAIGQMLLQRRRQARRDAAGNNGGGDSRQPAMLTRQMRRQLSRRGVQGNAANDTTSGSA